MKKCSKCGEAKKPSEFWKDSSKKDGLQGWCKTCIKLDKKQRYAKDPLYRERQLKRGRGRILSPEQKRLRRENHLARKFGLTLEVYAELYTKQKGKCALCGVWKASGGKNGLHVDHDHDSGGVRGLLCRWCNIGLGFYEGWFLQHETEVLNYRRIVHTNERGMR